MQFVHHDLGNRSAGDVVEIALSGNMANVRLMDSTNFQSYRNNRQHRCIGGLAKQSPVRLQIPNSGHWHIAVDLAGLKGSVRSSARILPQPMPPLPEIPLPSIPSLAQQNTPSHSSSPFERPLSSVPSLVQRDKVATDSHDGPTKEYDVFVSHASEDKDEVVRPLANALRASGLRVWYDEFELKIGDSLRRKIDKGLANSRFGVIVLSKTFLSKGWANYELDGLITRAITGEQVLLPIWHNISKREVIEYSPSLADKLARSTSDHTIEEISREIVEVITGKFEKHQHSD